MALTKEKKKETIQKFKTSKNDAGSAAVQVAILTERINGLSSHFEKNAKDHHSRRGLLTMVSRRKKLLAFVQRENPKQYTELLEKLNLRK